MKHLNKIIIALVLIMGLRAQAQDTKNPWAISFGVNTIDTKTSAGGGYGFLDRHFSQPFAIKDNWNFLGPLSYVGVSRYIGDNFYMSVIGSFNKISKLVTFNPTALGHDSRGYVVSNPGDLLYYGIDASINYSFRSIINSKKIDPSISLGFGYSSLGDNGYGTVNPGAGVIYWFSDNVGFELATKFKKSYGDRITAGVLDSPSVFQHSFGIVFKFEK
jgi:OOP family OmpA-OmpF porin